MSFLFYLKVKKIVLMIFSPILNVIDPILHLPLRLEFPASFLYSKAAHGITMAANF